MKKRLLLGLGVVLLGAIAAGWLFPTCRPMLLGWLGAEPFYAGRPASYWRQALLHEKETDPVVLAWRDAPSVILEFPRGSNVDTLPVLFVLLKDEDAYVRQKAAGAFGHLLPRPREAVPLLIETLKDPDEGVRWSSADSLGRIGLQAAPAIPGLLVALRDPSEIVRWEAAKALGRIHQEPATVIPALLAASKDPSELVACEAVAALGWFGPEARAALPVLEAMIKDERGLVSAMALQAAGEIQAVGREKGEPK